VIPLGDWCFPNTVTPPEARRRLGIPEHAVVVGAVGAIRAEEELDLLLGAFDALPIRNKYLLIAGKISRPSNYARRLLQRLRLATRLHTLVESGFIADEDIQLYVNASDLLVIPRHSVLNSGTIPLGFAFGRVVVGPDLGVVGELLRESENPVFDPLLPVSVTAAMQQGIHLAVSGKGASNADLLRKRWSWPIIAQAHAEFFGHLARTG
jgi:glycosyltransferase involved in cell wall biosynthesis